MTFAQSEDIRDNKVGQVYTDLFEYLILVCFCNWSCHFGNVHQRSLPKSLLGYDVEFFKTTNMP